MRRRVGLATVLMLAALAAQAQPGGIARVERLQGVPMLQSTAPAAVEATAFPVQAQSGDPEPGARRLDGARDGRGWWRLDPAASPGKRLLLVYNPYSARVTVRAPPDYRPRTQTVFDRDLDPRHSRHALVFPLAARGPIYVGVEGARYPLQVAVRDAGEYARADLRHVSTLFATTGVLIGVSLVALLFWIMLRDRVYLLYAVAMAAQLLYVLCAYGAAYALPGLRALARFGAAGVWFVATVSTVRASKRAWAGRSRGRGASDSRCPCCSWIWTTSSRSTMVTVMRWATPACARWWPRSRRSCASATISAASAARSFCWCCRTPAASARLSSPSASAAACSSAARRSTARRWC